MGRLLSLLFFATVSACMVPIDRGYPPSAADCDRTYYVSPDFPEGERQILDRAVRRWNEIAIEKFCLEDGEADRRAIVRIGYRGPLWNDLSNNGQIDLLGVHWYGLDNIGIVDVLNPRTFYLVALHEFGHAHGLSHAGAPAIMHASIGTASDFTKIDLAECVRVEACEADTTL
jgi:hypothetical protein